MSWNKLKARKSVILTLLLYLFLVGAVTAVLFWRFPNNVTVPNFYGEDGSVFLQNILNHGLSGALRPFNGYFIVGLYLLCGFGWLINVLFLGGTLITLPAAFALSAMIFMAAVISLPFLLFRKTFGQINILMVIAFSALLPLPVSPNVVIGTIGNQKWIFLYLAYLLVLYRVINHNKLSRQSMLALDVGILISAYTNSTVYLLAPLLLWPYLADFWIERREVGPVQYVKRTLRDREFVGVLVLFTLLIPQVIYIALHGIPKLPGYLDTPFQMSRAIELFINRTYLFGVTHVENNLLSNKRSVFLFILMVALAWKFIKGHARIAFWAGMYAAGMASLLFTINRPGVTDFFYGYKAAGSGPDQFFYAQTLVMYLPIVLLAAAVAGSIGNRYLRNGLMAVFAAVVIVSGINSNAHYGAQWRNASIYENDAGTFIDQAILSCRSSQRSPIQVVVYPYHDGRFSIHAPRADVCTSDLKHYQYSHEDLGLKVNNDDFSRITKSRQFTQTFIAGANNLDGLKLFISTFGVPFRQGTYQLELLDKDCTTRLRTASIPTALRDNSYYNVHFDPIAGSAGKTYCFTLDAPLGTFDPIAIQLSQANAYPDGQYMDGKTLLDSDVVFMPLYTPRR